MHAIWAHLRRNHEAEIALLPVLCPGGVAIDVGANRGLYTHHLSRRASRVEAFEPIPRLIRRLGRRVDANVNLHGVALSDNEGEAEIRIPGRNYSWATIQKSNTIESSRPVRAFVVPTRRLDSFGFQGVTIIKIDVEGHEESVLAGADRTVSDCRPVLVVEIEERHNPGAISRIAGKMRDRQYAGLFYDLAGLRPIETFDPAVDQPKANVSEKGRTGRYINNFVFIPTEKLEDIQRRVSRIGGH